MPPPAAHAMPRLSARLAALPLAVHLIGCAGLAMYLPAAHALVGRQLPLARAFFYSGTLTLLLAGLLGLALAGRRGAEAPRVQLATVFAAFTLLPLLLAVPFAQGLGDTRLVNAWFEMVSSFTTTGATLYDPARLAPSLHLWRALVGWLGGLFVLVMALAVLAPMSLGGFELMPQAAGAEGPRRRVTPGIAAATASRRLGLHLRTVGPFYLGLTGLLWVALLMAGDGPTVALCHAMAAISTSGISPVGGLAGGAAGRLGEAAIAAGLLFALSRRMMPAGQMRVRPDRVLADPEFRIGLAVVLVGAAGVLVVQAGEAIRLGAPAGLTEVLRFFWAAIFTLLSFLTTTGFVAADWGVARGWSGFATPGLVLMGFAMLGGGVATVAGGVKIFRVYVLALHGLREMEKILHPHSVGGGGPILRHLRSDGAFVAWIFFMLFALSIAAVVAMLSLTGLELETAMIFAISALTTTGPLAQAAAPVPLSFASLDPFARAVLGGAMVVGRMETLAIIALMAPDSWRR